MDSDKIDPRVFKNPNPSRGIVGASAGRLGEPHSVDQCNQACASEMPWQNPRDLIDQKIDRLNREVNELHALRRALPGEMSPQAERSLAAILKRAFALSSQAETERSLVATLNQAFALDRVGL